MSIMNKPPSRQYDEGWEATFKRKAEFEMDGGLTCSGCKWTGFPSDADEGPKGTLYCPACYSVLRDYRGT